MPQHDDHVADLEEANRRITEHPAYREYLEIRALERSIVGVLVPNLRELVGLLDAAATNPDLAMELIQNVREPTVRERFHAQLTQRLHNYLASAQSLVDHVRRLVRGRQDPFLQQFERRKAELLANPEVPFMINLRNYMLHRTLPGFAHTLSVTEVNTPNQRMESEVELGVAELLEWDGWTAPARKFLKAQGEVLRLRPVVKTHGKLLFELNTWIHDELAKANDPQLDEVNELIDRRNRILSGEHQE